MLARPPILTTKKESIEAIMLGSNEEAKPYLDKIHAEYYYWDKVKYLAPDGTFNGKMLWFAAKMHRRLNYRYIKFGNYTFCYTITDTILELLHELDMNIGGNLSSESIIPEQNKNQYLVSSIMEEAIASSQMEGASTTRKVAKEMLRKNEKPKNKGQQMIANNYQTIHYIKDHAYDDFSIERLQEIHRLMTKNTLDNPQEEGLLRTNDNIMVVDGVTGSVAHVPPAFAELDRLLHDLETFFNKPGAPFIHPVIKGIIIHFLLAYIHPFSDGNGRTSRSLFYWYLIKQGYWMIEYLSVSRIIYKSKQQYEKAFLYTEYDENDLTYFILYNLRTMKNAFQELKKYLKRKTEETKNVSLVMQRQGIGLRESQVLKIFMDTPQTMLTIKEVENQLAVSNHMARIYLTHLVGLGFLDEIAINKRKSGFVKSSRFEELLNVAFT
ncbi:MAG: Fic family protein [Prevotellaceae bacterium]|jgi:Fic family protein|nr:Fic family protein [Prevotellaceae bacterium]